MLVEGQTIETTWHSSSRKHYEDLGYVFTKYKDKLYVKAEDLSKSSCKIVKVSCDYCGKEINVKWFHHYNNIKNNQKDACYECRMIKSKECNFDKKKSSERYYKKLINACIEKDYVLLSNEDEIEGETSYIKYLCPIHGEKTMRVGNMLSGRGCPNCAKDKAREKYKLSVSEITQRISMYGGTLLNPEEYVNNSTKNLKILCPNCNNEFTTSLQHFLQHQGQICRECKGSKSKGELAIAKYLDNNNIQYEQEKWFDNCRDINPLPFDFFIPSLNTIIEFDGRQHFGETNWFSYDYKTTSLHDNIKNTYCENNGIHLIRIPYWQYNKINEILDKELNSHKDIV